MKRSKKSIINAWCMYDWANSVYSLVITSAIFPAYYQAYAVGTDGSDVIDFFGFSVINSVLYSYALSFSYLFVSFFLPLLSGIADYIGNKKIFMMGFMYIGATACLGMYYFEGPNVEWGIICSIFASIGYSGSIVFYDAFLPEIATSEETDRISAKGFSMGYLGSVILMIANIVTIFFYQDFGFETSKEATKFSFLTVGIWWILFSQIPLYYLPNLKGKVKDGEKILYKGYRELRKVWFIIKDMEVIKKYLTAFFFYNMGVQTIMLLAATFAAKVLGMEGTSLIVTILIIQVVAIAGAYFFANLSKRRGNKFSLQAMIIIWIGICIAAYLVTTQNQFYALAFVVGLVMGGIQALSRATYSKLIPSDTIDHASFFSFYDITYNISIVVGTFAYGFVEQLTQNMRNNTLVLMSFFIIGFILLYFVKIPFNPASNNEVQKGKNGD